MGSINDKDVAEQIAKLYDLHQAGVLSKDEFEQAKHRILGNERPRLVAQPPPGYDPERYRDVNQSNFQPERRSIQQKVDRVFLILGILLVVVIALAAIGSWLGGSNEDENNNNIAVAPTATTEPVPATPVDPTATAIPRTGIQTIRLSITVQDDWQAWGTGCVGGGDVDWANSDTGVVISPADASGTFRGRELGAGKLNDNDLCQWSVELTSRASDSYRITIGDQAVVCHSNMMFPTDDGFFAAVMVDGDGIHCATVTDVTENPPDATPSD